MVPSADHLAKSPEALIVGLAQRGDRAAFAELVGRRQDWIRNLLRRCTGDSTLADDLAQEVFMQAWRSLRQLQQASRFGPWLKRLAINTWLQHARRGDPLRNAGEVQETDKPQTDATAIAMDLDRALATLDHNVRLCIVLSYHEQMTHDEIAEFSGMPLGTVKSHIRRGSQRLQDELAAYRAGREKEQQQ